MTAWQSLVTHAKVKKGDKVLIHAAAGGVGQYAVQISKHFGAHVIGTGSAKNKEFILSLGADEFIDYENQTFEQVVQDADVVLDSIWSTHNESSLTTWGHPTHIERSLKALKKGGRLISLLTFFDDGFQEKLKEKDVFGHRLAVGSNGEDMRKMADLLKDGVLTSHVSQTFPFEEMQKTHLQMETGRTKGKLIVTV